MCDKFIPKGNREMRISSVGKGFNNTERAVPFNGCLPATYRHNSLSDMDFNIIADTIRCQNLKNQMNVRLMNLKRNLGNYNSSGDVFQQSS